MLLTATAIYGPNCGISIVRTQFEKTSAEFIFKTFLILYEDIFINFAINNFKCNAKLLTAL